MHPDDRWASDVLLSTARKMALNTEVDADTRLNGEQSYVCLGSPVSNALSRAFLEYTYIDPQKPQLGLRRSDSPLFKLPFEFELDQTRIRQLGKQEYHTSDRFRAVPNWSIKTAGGGYYIPETNSDDTDFLLITRLPNFLERAKFGDFKNTVTLFCGTHGTGTAALQLLFDREDLLREISERAENYECWQALLTINATKLGIHPVTGTERRIATSLATSVEFEPIST